MRVGTVEERPYHQVVIKVVKRDSREQIDEVNEATGAKTGRKVKNPRFGKLFYETVDTIDVYEAQDAEVKEAVLRGLSAAAKK